MKIERREFLATSLAAGAASLAGPLSAYAHHEGEVNHSLSLNYAPHFGMFQHHAGENLLDQLEFMTEQGFRALEDAGLAGRPVEVQKKIGAKLRELNMTMGTFVAACDYGNPTFAAGLPQYHRRVLADMKAACEVSQHTGAKYCTVIPGKKAPHLSLTQQTENTIELLKKCTAICEPAGLTILLEPLQHKPNSPDLYLHSAQAAAILCREVNSSCCKVLFDVPHQANITNDLFQELEKVWDQVAYLQIGDSQGRKEPGTGDIDYQRLVHFLTKRKFSGIVGMDHGNSLPGKPGELAVIEAYSALGNA